MSTSTPVVLFICVKNGGKSQMAAALMRHDAGDSIAVHSAGTHPGRELNALSRQVIEEIGATMNGEHPKPIDPDLLRTADRIIILGTEAAITPPPELRGTIETWDTDEPSHRGIEGVERMRLVRDDIHRHVHHLHQQLASSPPADPQGGPPVTDRRESRDQ